MRAKANKLTSGEYEYRGFRIKRDFSSLYGGVCETQQGWLYTPSVYPWSWAERKVKKVIDDIYSNWHELPEHERELIVHRIRKQRRKQQ